MTGAALILIAVAMLLVRLGWGGRRGFSALGWSAALAGVVLLTIRDGAWGMAVGTVTAMLAGFVLLAHAGWTSPAKQRRPAREIPSIALPHRWRDVARRAAVFVLVVPVAFVAAQWLAFGAQAVARRAGAVDADTFVLMLFLQPALWVALMAWQMTRAGPRRMLAPPAVAAVLGSVLWSLS